MVIEYFIIMGILLLCYPFVRYVFMDIWRLPPAPRKPVKFDGHPIDASALTERIHQVREEMPTRDSANQFAQFKRAQLVESKRGQMARLSFFQAPPPAPPSDPGQEHGSSLLLA